jgi:hypothetical protein
LSDKYFFGKAGGEFNKQFCNQVHIYNSISGRFNVGNAIDKLENLVLFDLQTQQQA